MPELTFFADFLDARKKEIAVQDLRAMLVAIDVEMASLYSDHEWRSAEDRVRVLQLAESRVLALSALSGYGVKP